MPSTTRAYISRILSPPPFLQSSVRRSNSIPALPPRRKRSVEQLLPGISSVANSLFPNSSPGLPPRILLLGATGSGKTTFMEGLQSFTSSPTAPTLPTSARSRLASSKIAAAGNGVSGGTDGDTGCEVQELFITPTQTAIFSDIAAADMRRTLRLHFSSAIAEADVGILFFLDAANESAAAMEELMYAVTYAKQRAAGRLRFVGVVLSKVDLVPLSTAERLIAKSGLVASVVGRQKLVVGIPPDNPEEKVEGREVRVERLEKQVKEALGPLLNGGETVWQVVKGRDGVEREWSLKSEHTVGEIMDLLAARMKGVKTLRRAAPNVGERVGRWESMRRTQRRWRSTRDVRTAGLVLK